MKKSRLQRKQAQKKQWQADKEEQARLKKQKRLLEKCENDIADFEAKLEAVNNEFLKPEVQTDLPKLLSLQKEKEEYEAKLADLYDTWEELASVE